MASPRADWAGRLDRIDRFCEGRGLDVVVVTVSVNLKYLTGFSGSSGLVVAGPRGRVFITDGRYEAAVRERMSEGSFASLELERVELRYDLTLGERLGRLGVRRAGFEAGHATVATLRHWREAAGDVDWEPTDEVVERLRVIKDEAELAVLRRGGRALSDVAWALRSLVAAGQSERNTARAIDRALERAGFERPAFDTIVASGPNSAYPHARPTDRRLQAGALMVLDSGGVLDGYCVDLTRMAAIGQIASAASA